MVESNDELFEHVPECVEVKIAYDLSGLPVLGVVFFWLFYFVARCKIGKEHALNSYWLKKGENRLWPPITSHFIRVIFTLLCIGVVVIFALSLLISFLTTDHGHWDAPYATTIQNLQTLRSAIDTYQAKTGTFPSNNLSELYSVEFDVSGKMRAILEDIPPEMISKRDYRPADQNPPNRKIYNGRGTEGGWFYDPASGKVFVNFNKPLGKEWGKKYAGENPSTW